MRDLHMGSPLPILGSHLVQTEFHAAHILAERCQLLQGQGQCSCLTALSRYIVALQSDEFDVMSRQEPGTGVVSGEGCYTQLPY